jgi:hypothetical protein
MKNFKNFLNEARKNADHPEQAKLNALQTLSKWKDDPSVHISYTKIRKIGLNPKTKYMDTPLAVFAYPLKQIWNDIQSEGVNNVRFAANTSKFIFVLKERGKKLIDVTEYRLSDLERDLKKIREYIGDSDFDATQAKIDAIPNLVKKDGPYRYLQAFIFHAGAYVIRKKSVSGSSAFLSSILIKLGYSGFSDRTGRGEIHSAEEIQSFFLSSKHYDVLSVIEIKEFDIKDAPIRDLADHLKKNAASMSDSEIIDIVSKDFSLAKFMGPPRAEVLKHFIDKTQKERWKSKQTRNTDPDYDGPDYVPAENFDYGFRMISHFKKLPEDFLLWGALHDDYQISAFFLFWMKKNKYKPSDAFLAKALKKNSIFLELVDSISLPLAKQIVKNHDHKYVIKEFVKKMSERDLFALLDSIDFDGAGVSFYHPILAKYVHQRLISKRNASERDAIIAARYIQLGRDEVLMNIVNDLKNRFSDLDFTQYSGLAFWKR